MVSKYVWQNYYCMYLHRTLRDVCFISLFPTLEYRKNAIFRHRKPFPRFFNVFPPLPSHVLRYKSGKSSVLSLLLHPSPFSPTVPQQGNPREKCIFVLKKYHAIWFSRSAKSKSDLFWALPFFEPPPPSISLPIFAFWERAISNFGRHRAFTFSRITKTGGRKTLNFTTVFFFDNAEIGGKVQDSRIPKVDSKKRQK